MSRRTGPARAGHHRAGRGGAFIALAAAGLAVLCGCGPTAQNPHASSPPPPSTSAAASPSATPSATRTAAAAPMARSQPARLRIPAIGVDTPVVALGLAPDGTVQVPPIAAHSPAGWYDGSPTPGQLGPSVILGHVTVGSYGDGVFLHLKRMHAGDRVSVTRKDGSVATFSVDSVQTVDKSHFPTTAVYGNVDHPALRLITCGGTRISGGGGYPDNVIVYASLVSGS